MARVDYWNHNVHYQPLILAAVPDHCGRALDVGCGDGLLAARLADRCAEVTGIASDPPMITRARARAPDRLRFTEADFLTHPLPEATSVLLNRYYQAVHHEGDPGAPVQGARHDLGPGPDDRPQAGDERV